MEEFRYLKNYKPSRFKAEGCIYKKKFADHAVFFINNLKHIKGQWYGQDFMLLDWQERIIRDIFGIVHRHNECRQFRHAYIEVPIKQGKSTFVSAVALLLACTDLERGGEIYVCTADKLLAENMFSNLVDMISTIPSLNRHFDINCSLRKMIFKPLKSFIRAVTPSEISHYGINAHAVIFDELCNFDERFYNTMTTATMLNREQPLVFSITSAGEKNKGAWWNLRQYSLQILSNELKNKSTFYPVIFFADVGDNWINEDVWQKANPSLGVTMTIEQFNEIFYWSQALLENRFLRDEWFKRKCLGMC